MISFIVEDISDRAFMEQLYIAHWQMMKAIAMRFADCGADADDIASEACLALMKKVRVLRELNQRALISYIVTTVKSFGIAYWRKKKRLTGMSDPELLKEEGPDVDYGMMRQYETRELTEAIQRLSETDQVLLGMKYWLLMEDREIAKRIGIKPTSVRSALRRARLRLKKILDEEGF